MRGARPAQHPLCHLFAVVTERCDYTLLVTGRFPELLRRIKRQRVPTSPDALLDYIETGKRSYRTASEFSYGTYRGEVPLFRKFKLCVSGLSYVRADLKHLRNPSLCGTLLN